MFSGSHGGKLGIGKSERIKLCPCVQFESRRHLNSQFWN